ncbi:MAG: ABC transporter substrate-binding protein [Zoogloeaceae bacterium]|jgi:sulfonate transport system substrate-binding protein|nr:ABC transporter substrate-binding protein [Zoogloeaceae bacterium]
MKNIFKPFMALALAFALGMTLSLSSPAHAEAWPEAVRIGVIASIDKAGNTVMAGTSPLVDRVIKEGWLEKELTQRGIKLEWYPLAGNAGTGSVTNEAFASGRIDFANYGDLPSIILNAGGVRTHVVVPSGRGSDMTLLVPVNSKIVSIQELKGKRVSVHKGRPWELGFIKAAESAGLTYKDFQIFNINPQAGAAALASGKVDAHFDIGGELLQLKGIGRIIWDTKGKPLHFKMRAELWGARAFTEKYPETTQLVATAYIKAAHWAAQEKNRDEIIRIGTRTGTPEEVVRKNYDDPTLGWKDRWTPLFDQVVYDHYREVTAFARAHKQIRRDVDANELLEPKFVRQALKTLKLEDFWTPAETAEKITKATKEATPTAEPTKTAGKTNTAAKTSSTGKRAP